MPHVECLDAQRWVPHTNGRRALRCRSVLAYSVDPPCGSRLNMSCCRSARSGLPGFCATHRRNLARASSSPGAVPRSTSSMISCACHLRDSRAKCLTSADAVALSIHGSRSSQGTNSNLRSADIGASLHQANGALEGIPSESKHCASENTTVSKTGLSAPLE